MPMGRTKFRDWSGHVARLLESVNDPKRLPEMLISALESLNPAKHTGLVIYRNSRAPIGLWGNPPIADASRYETQTLEVAPFAAAHQEGRSGCFDLWEIAPDGFEYSECYKELYGKWGIGDEIAHLTPMRDGTIVFAGCTREERFTEAEIKRHKEASPVIEAASAHIARLLTSEGQHAAPAPEEPIDSTLDRFGAEVLTPREQEVIQLVLRGHSTESAARRLEIAENTVKRHRLQAYTKLNVRSQGELFYKFLRSVGLHPDT